MRNLLEQALLTLPRQRGADAVALQIEEAIDVAIELEFSRPAAAPPSAQIVGLGPSAPQGAQLT